MKTGQLVWIAVLLTAGCASTNAVQLEKGTTVAQAATLVGRPRNVVTAKTSNGPCEMWPATLPCGGYFEATYYRIFCNGKYNQRSFPAEEIYEAYQRNKIAADQTWGNAWFFVNGTITDIGKDIMGTPYVALHPGRKSTDYGMHAFDNVGAVQCMFARGDADKLAKLKPGDGALLRCERAGFLLMNVILNSCSFFDGTKP